MPYIAFDLDAIAHVPDVARAANTSDGAIAWGLLRLWQWCWRIRTDVVTPDHVRGFFGTDVTASLVAFGFIEALGDGTYRVKGCDRYLRLHAARSAGGKASIGNLKRGTQPGASRGTSREAFPAVAGSQPGVVPGCAPALTASSEQRASNKRREEAPLRDRLDVAWLELRGAAYVWDWADEKAVSPLLAHGEAAILERWRRALKWVGYPTCNSIKDLLKHWNAYAKDQPTKAAASGDRPRL